MTMSDPLVCLEQVSKNYQQLQVLDKVSMTLDRGEVLGLFGHNGAGKTTMMKLILGIVSPSAGRVSVLGCAPDSKAAWHSRSKVGYLPENVSFYDQLTGLEVLSYFARLKGFSKKQAMALLEQVGIAHAMKRQVKTYSKGMRQRLGLAQALIGEPRLLLLDEPTVGLDPIATANFYQTVDQLKSRGTSIILCSHVLPGVEQHIDRAMILSTGKVLAMGTLAELRKNADLPVTIRYSGINGAMADNSLLVNFLSKNKDTLLVPEGNKIAVLQQLLSYPALTDLQVETPTLEQLYQYYLSGHQSPQNTQIAGENKP